MGQSGRQVADHFLYRDAIELVPRSVNNSLAGDTEMKRALITMMLTVLLAGIPLFAEASNERTASGILTATYSPGLAHPQYRLRYYRRRHRRHVRYVVRRRYYRPRYRRVHVYRRRRY